MFNYTFVKQILSPTESHKRSKTQDCYQHSKAQGEAEPSAQPGKGQDVNHESLSHKTHPLILCLPVCERNNSQITDGNVAQEGLQI